MANLPLAFAELLAGGILITAGTTGDSIGDVMKGQIVTHPLPGSTSSSGGSGTAAGAAASSSSGATPKKGAPGTYVNPVPGSTASRVDQGVDYTGKSFLALGNSKILASDTSNGGWGGGGYIAGQLLDGPYAGKVWYMAEGLLPHVSVGDVVNAGQSIASPAPNPLASGLVGNIEAGWASASNPELPLAKSTGGYIEGHTTAAGLSFNRLVQSLGGPLGHLAGSLLGDVKGLGLP